MGGALTSHHKRGNNYDNTHISKKQKIQSFMDNYQNSSHFSSDSRFNRYPDEPEKRIPRAASRWSVKRFTGFFSRNKGLENEGSFDKLGKNGDPLRDRKFGLAGIVGLSDERGGELLLRYERTRKCVVDSIRDRYCKKDEKVGSFKEVIDLDKDDDSDDDDEVEKVDCASKVIDLDKEDDSDDDDEVEIVEKGSMVTELEDAGKILETLLLDSDEDSVVRLSVDKNLLRELFLPLTDEEKDEVSRAFSEDNRRKVLVTHENSNIDITGDILQCLRPEEWLNDEVINVYFHLLKEREDREPNKFLKCHFFNTFFYKKLISGKSGYDYRSVRRWTTHKKLGYNLSECDKIFVPIHQRAHWCLAVINKKDQKFQYLDSLRGIDTKVLQELAMYYVDELKDKIGVDIDVLSWTQEHVENIPVQKNGSDCGMFMIKYADFYSRGLGLCFNQKHMPYFRLRTAKEILRLEA